MVILNGVKKCYNFYNLDLKVIKMPVVWRREVGVNMLDSMDKQVLMASYATYKSLYSNNKYRSPYDILAEFIKYIICCESLSSFSVNHIKIKLKDHFGFDLPVAVIEGALRKRNFIRYNDTTKSYIVNFNNIKENKDFLKYTTKASEDNAVIVKRLIEYIHNKGLHKYYSDEQITQSFVQYLLDEHVDNELVPTISEFVLLETKNESFTNQITSIRTGSILYAGLCQKGFVEGVGDSKLSLFLDTEVMFDLAGFNGPVYEELAKDLIRLVNEINRHNKKIFLYYFRCTKKEIDNYFAQAEMIIAKGINEGNNVAMNAIINGCCSTTDVVEKQVDFYDLMKSKFCIYEDLNDIYYQSQYDKYNLEESEIDLSSYETEKRHFKTDDIAKAIKYNSHINKLRLGKIYQDYSSCNSLFVTRTTCVLCVSRCLIKSVHNIFSANEKVCGYALDPVRLTNILWYKLNSAFSNNPLPKNVNILIKAKLVLSTFITNEVNNLYVDILKKNREGQINEYKMNSYLLALKKKAMRPEEINEDNVEDALNFDDNYLARFEKELENAKELYQNQKEELTNKIREKEFAIKELEDNSLKQKEVINQHEQKVKDTELKLQKQMQEVEREKTDNARMQAELEQLKNQKNNFIKAAIVLFSLFVLAVLYYLFHEWIEKTISNEMYVRIGLWSGLFAIVTTIVGVCRYFYTVIYKRLF